jgi:hypothetical protein
MSTLGDPIIQSMWTKLRFAPLASSSAGASAVPLTKHLLGAARDAFDAILVRRGANLLRRDVRIEHDAILRPQSAAGPFVIVG